jgi:phage tail sheath protein FI
VSQADIDAITEAYLITLNLVFQPSNGPAAVYEGLATGGDHPRYIGTLLAEKPTRRADQLAQPVALHVEAGTAQPDADTLLTALVGSQPTSKTNGAYVEPSKSFNLGTGTDGTLPDKAAYEAALALLVGLEDISIVAAPGYSVRSSTDYQGIQDALLSHVGVGRRYRIGVLDAPPDQTPSTMRDLRGLVDSNRAAMYYPWVVVNNPLAGPNSNQPAEIILPPSGFVCGIYARNDIERGVWKAPANEVVRGTLRFERHINHGEQELLNPIGVNCLRYLSGRGFRVWGARTVSSDPEWKYVNVRRYFNYLESSIDRGTQWVVFEPNGETLWANVRGTVSDFLLNEWRSGALLGGKQDEAFFVRCDRTTMTQNDLDNGRLICLIGVAVVKPAELVIFRIGQKTVEAKA